MRRRRALGVVGVESTVGHALVADRDLLTITDAEATLEELVDVFQRLLDIAIAVEGGQPAQDSGQTR